MEKWTSLPAPPSRYWPWPHDVLCQLECVCLCVCVFVCTCAEGEYIISKQRSSERSCIIFLCHENTVTQMGGYPCPESRVLGAELNFLTPWSWTVPAVPQHQQATWIRSKVTIKLQEFETVCRITERKLCTANPQLMNIRCADFHWYKWTLPYKHW